jgi:hypothetical protein
LEHPHDVHVLLRPGPRLARVHFSYLKELGLNPGDFSSCSYRKHNVFYLEEDCDAPKFLAAFQAKHGTNPKSGR